MMYLGDFDLSGAVITIPFTTHEADGGSVAPSSAFEADDVRIYKNSSATQRASTSGVTMTSPFDSVTGLHILSIDITDDDDVGFFDSGNDYHVVLVPDETVDGQTVVKLLATFSIQNRYNEVTVGAVGSAAITSTSFAAGAITAGVIATDAIGSDELAASAITEIQSGLATSSALTTVGTNVDTVLTRLGTPSNLGGGATISANLSDIEGQTDDIGAAGAGLTAIPWNAAWDAEVQSEANDALVANNLDHLLAASVAGTDVVDNSVIAKIVSKSATADWDSFVNTTDALEAIRDKETDIETDTQDVQNRLPAALTSGRIDASVGAMAAGVVTASAVATGAIDADALAADAVDEILDEVVEGSLTMRQVLRLVLSALAGKAAGGGTTTVTFRDNADSKNRISATVDASGNRTAVTLDGS